MNAGDVTMTNDRIPVERMDLDEAMELAARIADPEDGCVEEMMEFGADVCDVLRCEVARLTADLVRIRAVVSELVAAEAAHDAALAGSDHDEWTFATRMAPINARVEAARAALDALTKSDGGDRG